jgi:hypothetical protein
VSSASAHLPFSALAECRTDEGAGDGVPPRRPWSWSPPMTPTPGCGPVTAAPSPGLGSPRAHHRQWDNGSTLSVLPDAGDHLSKLPGDHTPTHADPASGPPTTTRPPPASPAAQLRCPANRPSTRPRPTYEPPVPPPRPTPSPGPSTQRRRHQTTPGGTNGGHPIGHRPPHPRGWLLRQLLPPRRLPAHQGRVLFEAVTGHFGGDTNAACSYLLDEHPAGWSVLHGDVTTPPGYRLPTDPDDLRNQCYCHGDRHDPPRAAGRSHRQPGRGRLCLCHRTRPAAGAPSLHGGWQPVADPVWTAGGRLVALRSSCAETVQAGYGDHSEWS